MKSGSGVGVKSSRSRLGLAATVMVLAVLASLASAAAAGAGSSGTPNWTVKLRHGGTFTLAQSIQDKIKANKTFNYVFSYGSCSIQGFSQQYLSGYKTTLPQANKIYPTHGTSLCPPQTQQDVNTQINQISRVCT